MHGSLDGMHSNKNIFSWAHPNNGEKTCFFSAFIPLPYGVYLQLFTNK